MNQPRLVLAVAAVALASAPGAGCNGQIDLGTFDAGNSENGSMGVHADGGNPNVLSGESGPPPDSNGCPVLAANEDLIDDMEGVGEPFIPAVQGRIGMWSDGDDMTPGSPMFPPTGMPFQVSDTGDPCFHHAARVTGGPFVMWGATMDVSLGVPYDASPYIGITFWARADPPLTVGVAFPTEDTSYFGGICDPNGGTNGCYDNYVYNVPLGGSDASRPTYAGWTKYTVYFANLKQDVWGNVQPHFDPSRLYGIQLDIVPGPMFDIWIDDLAFLRSQ